MCIRDSHYNNAITASIIYWGGTAAEAATYLANPLVKYTTAAGSWKQKIGTQKWIALFNRPYDGWVEERRLDFPVLPLPLGAKSGFPNRLTFPSTEQTTNGAAYTAVSYTHLRAHETPEHLVCRLLLEKKKK